MKVNYMQLLRKTSKEFVVTVKRTIEYEKLTPSNVQHIDSKQHHDVVIETDSRMVAIRAVKGKKQAHIKEFEWSEWLDAGKNFASLIQSQRERGLIGPEWQ